MLLPFMSLELELVFGRATGPLITRKHPRRIVRRSRRFLAFAGAILANLWPQAVHAWLVVLVVAIPEPRLEDEHAAEESGPAIHVRVARHEARVRQRESGEACPTEQHAERSQETRGWHTCFQNLGETSRHTVSCVPWLQQAVVRYSPFIVIQL